MYVIPNPTTSKSELQDNRFHFNVVDYKLLFIRG